MSAAATTPAGQGTCSLCCASCSTACTTRHCWSCVQARPLRLMRWAFLPQPTGCLAATPPFGASAAGQCRAQSPPMQQTPGFSSAATSHLTQTAAGCWAGQSPFSSCRPGGVVASRPAWTGATARETAASAWTTARRAGGVGWAAAACVARGNAWCQTCHA